METMGTPASLPHLKMSRENPAPVKIRSIFSSMALWTREANWRTANMILMPIMPLVRRLAVLISFFSSSTVIPVAPMTPIPPALATAAARGAVETRIAIPP